MILCKLYIQEQWPDTLILCATTLSGLPHPAAGRPFVSRKKSCMLSAANLPRFGHQKMRTSTIQGRDMNLIKKQARVAGLWYLLGVPTSIFSLFYVPTTLVVSGDAAATMQNISALSASV